MCVIALAHNATPRHRLIVAANRDESHARATLAAAWWRDAPDVLGGRDAKGGGTWLAIDKRLRFAAVTNVRGAPPRDPSPRSRGRLVSDFLTGDVSASRYVAALTTSEAYAPFNLLLFDGQTLEYASNRALPRQLSPGVHAFSNAGPDSAWPKVVRARRRLEDLVDEPDPTDALFALLSERGQAAEGFDERQVSLFQLHPIWGTRSSTVILVAADGKTRFVERSFDAAGARTGEVEVEFSPTR
jgi:uncharacterized protein with NRDE domain